MKAHRIRFASLVSSHFIRTFAADMETKELMDIETHEINPYVADAVELLKRLIATPSVSREEDAAATLLMAQMEAWGLTCRREGNNVWTVAPHYDERRPTLLLNAHIDTVKPVATWTRPPFEPQIEGDRLYGLGSNDCGGGRFLIGADRSGYRRSYIPCGADH